MTVTIGQVGDDAIRHRLAKELLEGAIDLHRHGRPEFSQALDPQLEDLDDLLLCRKSGMVGLVLKSHVWPTYDRTAYLRTLVQGIDVYASITLNPVVGGFNSAIVELAANHGVRVIFFPTWGARHDRERGGLSRRLEETLGWTLPIQDGLTVCTADGELRDDVTAVLEVARAHELIVFTGHVAPSESIALARSGLVRTRLVFSHPDSHSVGASPTDVRAMANQGALVELCAIGAHPRFARVTHRELAETVENVGAKNCVITSDVFFPWSGPSSVLLESLIYGLLREGVTPESVRTMLHENPAQLLSQSRDESAERM